MKAVGKPRLLLSVFVTVYSILFGLWIFQNGYIPAIQYSGLFLVVISILVIFPTLLRVNSMWMVNAKTIQYSESFSIFDSFNIFFNHYLRRKEINYPVKINLDSIQSIRVTYSKHLALFNTGIHYDVWLVIRTKDNSEFRINVLGNGNKRKDVLEAFQLLEDYDVSMIDEYGIIEYLKTSSKNISYYLEKVDKKRRGKL